MRTRDYPLFQAIPILTMGGINYNLAVVTNNLFAAPETRPSPFEFSQMRLAKIYHSGNSCLNIGYLHCTHSFAAHRPLPMPACSIRGLVLFFSHTFTPASSQARTIDSIHSILQGRAPSPVSQPITTKEIPTLLRVHAMSATLMPQPSRGSIESHLCLACVFFNGW